MRLGASDERPRGSRQLHHYGGVRQYGEPLACGASASRFELDTSHCLTPLTYRLSDTNQALLIGRSQRTDKAPLSTTIASCLSDMLILEGQGHRVTVRLKSYRIILVANGMVTLEAKWRFDSVYVAELFKLADLAQLAEQRTRNA